MHRETNIQQPPWQLALKFAPVYLVVHETASHIDEGNALDPTSQHGEQNFVNIGSSSTTIQVDNGRSFPCNWIVFLTVCTHYILFLQDFGKLHYI
jgi:hypothetical protein